MCTCSRDVVQLAQFFLQPLICFSFISLPYLHVSGFLHLSPPPPRNVSTSYYGLASARSAPRWHGGKGTDVLEPGRIETRQEVVPLHPPHSALFGPSRCPYARRPPQKPESSAPAFQQSLVRRNPPPPIGPRIGPPIGPLIPPPPIILVLPVRFDSAFFAHQFASPPFPTPF